MNRIELSDRNLFCLKKAVWYYWSSLCVHGEAATSAVVNGWDQHYTVDDYIQIWKLNDFFVHGKVVLTPTDVKRIRRLYGKTWRGEQDWQQFAKMEKEKHQRWDNEEMMGKKK